MVLTSLYGYALLNSNKLPKTNITVQSPSPSTITAHPYTCTTPTAHSSSQSVDELNCLKDDKQYKQHDTKRISEKPQQCQFTKYWISHHSTMLLRNMPLNIKKFPFGKTLASNYNNFVF